MAPDPQHGWALHKRLEVADCLEGAEYQEWWDLSGAGHGRRDLTPTQQARLVSLEATAATAYRRSTSERPVHTPENDLRLYAQQIAEQREEQVTDDR